MWAYIGCWSCLFFCCPTFVFCLICCMSSVRLSCLSAPLAVGCVSCFCVCLLVSILPCFSVCVFACFCVCLLVFRFAWSSQNVCLLVSAFVCVLVFSRLLLRSTNTVTFFSLGSIYLLFFCLFRCSVGGILQASTQALSILQRVSSAAGLGETSRGKETLQVMPRVIILVL